MVDGMNKPFGVQRGLMSAVSSKAAPQLMPQPMQQKPIARPNPTQGAITSTPMGADARSPMVPKPPVANPVMPRPTSNSGPAVFSAPANGTALGVRPAQPVAVAAMAQPTASVASTPLPTPSTTVSAQPAASPRPVGESALRQNVMSVQSVLADRDAEPGVRREAAMQLRGLAADPDYERVATQTAVASMPADRRRDYMMQMRQMLQSASPAERERYSFLLGGR